MLGHRRTLHGLLLMLLLNLGGCASWFSDDSVDPAVHLVKVEVVRAKLLEQKFILHFRIDNPNDSDLTVRSLEYRIHLADLLLAEGEHEHWFTVGPKRSAYFKVPIRTNLWPRVKDVVKMLKSPNQQIPYRLQGEMETGLFIAHYVHLERNGVIIPADLIPEQHR
ncbi:MULTISPECIES: LEA type 2 family protein [unclassified Pseudomonas]|jgi:LEA14-like dessication related protein|uniref:LEA type 2 family protein n=1 Tax=unclassified Pseudomonas TaxID=196821 RepID=UPI002A37016B|nr:MULTISPECIES: LEA type 2 family protein [unclassified Pseudomonas]MDX9673208.1 LEA type 2 family protein [Pseudomonas sp. P8_250]WPN38249.1 LEA type 2 family protein [Pseudomonas sp. P8_139]WPN39949.1 LEA type 2 family protein [Pseudomonas sp. P8_229]